MNDKPLSAQLASATDTYEKLTMNIKQVIKGQEKAIRWLIAGFVTGGHILLDDYPGTGKTTLAKCLALSTASDFKRIQFTPDLLPSDILGVSIYDNQTGRFRLHKGPIFTHILLADEINRASPRTQSALLEAMAEGQVSIDGELHPLTDHFFVIATQNPVESRGTYPLPEAQMDRFAMQFSLGYVSETEEAAILSDQGQTHPLFDLRSCVNLEDLNHLKTRVTEIDMRDSIQNYIVKIVRATRIAKGVLLGASPRASIALMKTAKALALFDRLSFVTPDHIKEIAAAVIAHRMIMDPQAKFSGKTAHDVLNGIIESIPVPV